MKCRHEGCAKEKPLTRGLCYGHYSYARIHKLLDQYPRTKRAENGAPIAFLREHVNYPWENCLLWPFAKAWNGYPELRFEGRPTRAHRLMCKLAHGEPPEPHYEASHTCEHGHLGCVNPRHLVWETHAENHARRAGRKIRRKAHPDMILG